MGFRAYIMTDLIIYELAKGDTSKTQILLLANTEREILNRGDRCAPSLLEGILRYGRPIAIERRGKYIFDNS